MKKTIEKPYWFIDNTTGSRQSFLSLPEAETAASQEPGMLITIHTPETRITVKASGRVEYQPFKTIAA